MYELKVVSRFAAAHQLRMVGDKCENLHGHNWKIEVYARGPHLNQAGVLMDFGELKACLKNVLSNLDHKFLNEEACFQGMPASSENIARYIALGMQEQVSAAGVDISRVTAWESEDACATYYP